VLIKKASERQKEADEMYLKNSKTFLNNINLDSKEKSRGMGEKKVFIIEHCENCSQHSWNTRHDPS